MYKLVNNEEMTEEIKNAFKYNVTRGYLYFPATETQTELTINENNYLKGFDFDDSLFTPNEGIIGSTIAKEITGNFVNVDSNFSVENREFDAYIGADINENTTKYIKLGRFIIQKPENDDVNDNTQFTALDYMIKFNKQFEDRLNYNDAEHPVTIGILLQDICNQVGVTLATTTFRNSDFVLQDNQFVSGESCRTVLKAIAQMAFSWARINQDNELVLDFDLKDTIDEEIDYDEYTQLEHNEEYGELNTIILRNSQIEGENFTIHSEGFDEETDEEVSLVISDNPFAYTEAKRIALIEAGRAIMGFRYVPIKMKDIGLIYLNCQDKIKIKNMQNEYYETYIFNNKIHYQGIATGEKETPALMKTEVQYAYTGNISESIKKAEISVDKANGLINYTVSRIDTLDENYSDLQATLTARIDGVDTDLQGYKVQVTSNIEQSAESVTRNFTTIIYGEDGESGINGSIDEVNNKLLELNTYIREDADGILIGKTGNPITLRLGNDRISFYQDSSEVAYISDNKLYITDGQFLNSLQLGNFAFTPRTNGSLSFGKVV